MSTVLMVGTRKGLWIGTSDDGAGGVGLHRPAPRHGGGLLLHGRHPRRPRRGCCRVPRRAGSARRCAGPTTSARPGRRRPTARSGSPRTRTRPSSGSGSSTPGAEAGVVCAGTEPGAVWRSDDGGETSRSSEALWDHPQRPDWGAGFGGQAFHTILPHPTDPQSVTVAISTGGVYQTTDGGASWTARNQGIRAEFLPEGQQYPEFGQCVHKVTRHPSQPERLYLQNHGGVYRSDDHGASLAVIGDGLPSDFGFAIVVHPHEPDTVYVFPINGGDGRYPTGRPGPGLALHATPATPGRSSATGLPDDFYVGVMRDAMCADDHDAAGPLLRRSQRRGLGLGRCGGDLAPDRRRPARRDGGARRRDPDGADRSEHADEQLRGQPVDHASPPTRRWCTR